MADFLDKLGDAIEARRDDFERQLHPGAAPGEEDLKRLVRDHWSPLPPAPPPADWPAYAIDGSIREVSLDNGSYLFIVQALCIGEDAFEEPRGDVQILPPATPRPTASRFADLLQRHHELSLACEMVARLEPASVLFLDGALYGLLPQLYSLSVEEASALSEYPDMVLKDYIHLLNTARECDVTLVAVSKTSREATHCKIWMRALEMDSGVLNDANMTDSALVHRWTDRAAGVSAPVLLGTWGFTGGSRELLEREEVHGSPAIVSFFIRLADLDDALRIDVPASQVGSDACLGDVKGTLLEGDVEAVRPIVDILAADYGGLEVYNALLYSVDREVRLHRNTVNEVILPLIGDVVGHEVRPDRSERRF